MPLHVEISPIDCQVSEKFLFRDNNRQRWETGKIIAISSYPGSVPTFKVLLENGGLFSYVPSSEIRAATAKGDSVSLNKSEFVFKTCKEEDEGIFDSFSDFLTKKEKDKFYMFPLETLVYNNSPEENLSITIFSELKHHKVVCYLKEYKMFISGSYILTLDWAKSNVLLHLIELQNGQFAFIPNHKILFNNNPKNLKELPKYRAVHSVFKIKD